MSGVGALYLHVPFCARKCAYCDFLSRATPKDDPCLAAYAHELESTLRHAVELGLLRECRTAYVGGGTPTLLGASLLGELVRAVRAACPDLTELSCEANPESLTRPVLDALVRAGATRLSIGVQSLMDDELAALGRIHSADQARACVRDAVASGLDVSVDLMCAIPHQTDASWRRTLREVLDLGVAHVSVYPLAIEEGTPLERRYANVPTPWNDEDVQADRMEEAEAMLSRAGYHRYEVASYARPGKECRHNIAYWTGVPYLGLGRGAASMLGHDAYDAARELLPWLPAWPERGARARFTTADQQAEFLGAQEAWAEDLMLGMRLTRGLDESRLARAQGTVDDLVRRGLVARQDGRVVPTHDGWLLGNELFGALWDLADAGQALQ